MKSRVQPCRPPTGATTVCSRLGPSRTGRSAGPRPRAAGVRRLEIACLGRARLHTPPLPADPWDPQRELKELVIFPSKCFWKAPERPVQAAGGGTPGHNGGGPACPQEGPGRPWEAGEPYMSALGGFPCWPPCRAPLAGEASLQFQAALSG